MIMIGFANRFRGQQYNEQMFCYRCFCVIISLKEKPFAVDGRSSREEVIVMYITLTELLALGVFVIELITFVLRIKHK